jgi:hypothetical protein
MVVGDELQSIYGFRHADLDVFREQRRAVERSADAATMELSGNLPLAPGGDRRRQRGRREAARRRLPPAAGRRPAAFAAPARRRTRGRAAAHRAGRLGRRGNRLAPATDADTPPNHLAEARFVAARLRELAESGVERGEMVVLLRAFTHLDAYEDSLERAGLRPYTIGGRGYWSQQQVADVCALLATIANPLDDQALFGALASPACGAAPDTLWLLRAAAGRGRHVWPAVRQAGGREEAELDDRQRLEAIPEPELTLLREFVGTVEALRERAGRLSLAELIDTALAETGYDLAVLMRPAGEARFANVRKLMRLAGEFEAREGRDLRGLLDFLASRAEADADAEAATRVEGHDGVRIMTVHSAKGLEFGVVAVPHSRAACWPARGAAAYARPRAESREWACSCAASAPARSTSTRTRSSARRAAARSRGGAAPLPRRRDPGARAPDPERRGDAAAGPRDAAGTAVVERILSAFDVDRERDSTIAVTAPEPREGSTRASALLESRCASTSPRPSAPRS